MNYDLLKNHIEESTKVAVPQLEPDGSNVSDFYVPDVVGKERFAQNYGGYPRSDIALINEQTNLQIAQSMLKQIEDYSPKDNPNAGLRDTEIMLGHRSKYMQTASEQQDWLVGQLAIRDARRAEAIRVQQQAQQQQAQQQQSQQPKVVPANPE